MIKKINDSEYALYEYNKTPTYWEKVQERMLAAGGKMITLEVEKLRLGKRDPITGWCEKIFDRKITVEGVVIPKAATELIEAAKIKIDGDFNAALITRDPVDLGDRFKWQEYTCIVWNSAKIPEGNELSYNILYLKTV